ncbi:MAG: hypothetical protein ACR2QQ_08215 [Gammaproteobacteria bacterium]
MTHKKKLVRLMTALLFPPLAATLFGCETGTSSGPAGVDFEEQPATSAGVFVAQYAPPVDVGPYPNDIYNLPGQTLSVPQKITSPLAEALNTLDGFSTSAKITAPFNDRIDPATLIPFNPLAAPTGAETIFVFNATAMTPLVPGLHYEVRISSALGTNGSVVEFVPLMPLDADTTYAFLLTDGISNASGIASAADTVFGLVRDAHLAGVMTGNPGLDALLPAIGPLIDLGVGSLGLPGSSIVSAWSVSTQSINDVYEWIAANATPQVSVIASAGLNTAGLGLGLPGLADVYAGFVEAPYFGDPTDVLESLWINSSQAPLTRDDPVPIPRGGTLRLPLIATLPNTASGQTKPAGGWPVVIVQHGVTVNRLVSLAVADAFAQAGFAMIAIDLPLHGITDTSSPFFQGPASPFGDNERHFGLDNVGPVGDLMPDGAIDDGWQIFNVANPLNARDHARQVVSDLFHLVRTAPTMDFDGDMSPDLDGDRRHFVSLSLGSILVVGFLANTDEVNTVSMTSVGGPFSDFLYDPEAVNFGFPIRDGIVAQGLPFGSLSFDGFARDLQTAIDPIDPVNYAAAAAARHSIHLIEIVGDESVPNGLTATIAALMGIGRVNTTTINPTGASGLTSLAGGEHSSPFNPIPNLAVTVEAQTQMVTYAASGGTTLLITNPSVVQ